MRALLLWCGIADVAEHTTIYIAAESAADGHELRTVNPLRLLGAEAAGRAANEGTGQRAWEIRVETDDEEWFPVKRSLLQPCISLTAALRDSSCEQASVPLDCLIFDKAPSPTNQPTDCDSTILEICEMTGLYHM